MGCASSADASRHRKAGNPPPQHQAPRSAGNPLQGFVDSALCRPTQAAAAAVMSAPALPRRPEPARRPRRGTPKHRPQLGPAWHRHMCEQMDAALARVSQSSTPPHTTTSNTSSS
uniref:Uncharacterized protein n=1 Tax=Neobodo designis TaxID=312471 RepID=A0A7S1QIE3_NEODS|mmetsp:Transcript_46163/g.142312  ORF Transcript_46163/g.142312 Transcript_46163/m.142312 type:complete len:115 (+) Transcript_46163:77-421(+)